MSSKETTHMTQVKLGCDNATQVAWIDSTGAKVRNRLTLKGDDDDRVWTVLEVYDTQLASTVKAHERDYLSQRAASDI